MHSVVSEDRFWDAQFVGGENEPRIIAWLRSCDYTRNCSLCNQRCICVPIVVPAPHNLQHFGDYWTLILVVGQNLGNDTG